MPVVDGAHMLGNIMLSCQNVIPKNTKIIDINVNFGHDRITVYDIEVLLANSRIPNNIYIDSTEFIYPRLIHSVLYKKYSILKSHRRIRIIRQMMILFTTQTKQY